MEAALAAHGGHRLGEEGNEGCQGRSVIAACVGPRPLPDHEPAVASPLISIDHRIGSNHKAPQRVLGAYRIMLYSILPAEDFAIGLQRAISASTNLANVVASIFSASMLS